MASAKSEIATEGGRFGVQPMATDLTIECARKFLKELLDKGGDSVKDDIESGRATRDFSPEEVEAILKNNFPT